MVVCLKLAKIHCTTLHCTHIFSILTLFRLRFIARGKCNRTQSLSNLYGESHSPQGCDVLVPFLPGRVVVDVIKQINAGVQ